MTGEAGDWMRGWEVWNTCGVSTMGLRCFLSLRVAKEGKAVSSSVSERKVEKVSHLEVRRVVGLGWRKRLQSSSESELS